MGIWTATFFSHYGALRFKTDVEKRGCAAYLRPVPRSLSASCGTCVVYTAPSWDCVSSPDLDGVYRPEGEGYVCVWRHG